MRIESDIRERITDYKRKLALIETRMAEELSKEAASRDFNVLRFLLMEKNVWQFSLAQLEWVLATA